MHPDGVLTFGLIWLDYLRQREPSLAVQGLILYLPAGRAKTTCLRLLFLDPAAAQYSRFCLRRRGAGRTNRSRATTAISTRTWSHTGGVRTLSPPWPSPGVETIELGDGELSFRVHGLEFARTAGRHWLSAARTKSAPPNCHGCDLPMRPTAASSVSPESRGLARIAGARHISRRSTPACCPRRYMAKFPRSRPPTGACWICWPSTTAGGWR